MINSTHRILLYLQQVQELSKAGGNGVMKLFGLQIVSGSRDKTIKLWNTLGECKFTIGEGEGHTEWVSCVRFSPVTTKPIIVSAGWDRLVKVPPPPGGLYGFGLCVLKRRHSLCFCRL